MKPFAYIMTGATHNNHCSDTLIMDELKSYPAKPNYNHTRETPLKMEEDLNTYETPPYLLRSSHLSLTAKDSMSPSPFRSYLPSDTESDQERDELLLPKYTSDTMETSNISSIGNQSARSSASCVNYNVHSFYVNSDKNDISTNLIYDNMDKYAASISTPHNDEDESFLLIESEDEEDHFMILPYYEEETEDELETVLSAPQIDIQCIETSDVDEEIYDEEGDFSINIPQEFRSLNLNIRSATYDNNLSLMISSDTDDESDGFLPQNTRKERRHSVPLNCKIKRHTPPKHIQQKMEIHTAIKELRCNLTPPNLPDYFHFNEFDVESPREYSEDIGPSTFLYNQFSNESAYQNGLNPNPMELVAELSGSPKYDGPNDEKHFDWTVHPNDIRLSDEACQHLVSLMEYQTDDESL